MVSAGQSFWSIAVSQERSALGAAVTPAQIAAYWVLLVQANSSRLVHPHDPDLIYPGNVLVLPAR